MDDGYWVAIAVFTVMLLLGFLNSRGTYSRGVLDGWRAHKSPNDALWQRKIKPTIEDYWPCAWAEAEDRIKESRR